LYSGVIETVKVAVPSFPTTSLAVAVHTLSVVSVTVAAVKTFVATSKLPPFVQETVAVAFSVTVKVAVPVAPDCTINVAGVNVRTGAVVSGVMVTVNVAVPTFPAASLAVAVQTDSVFSVKSASAVNTLVATSKLPPVVQSTSGPTVTPTLSVAVSVEVAVMADSTLSVAGLNETAGAVVSAAGGGGGGGGLVVPPLLPPPPQADKSSADASESAGR